MEFSWVVFAVGLALGVVQLAVGVFVGRAMSGGRQRREAPVLPPVELAEPPEPSDPSLPPDPRPLDPEQIRAFTHRLYRLVTNVADDVNRHQIRIEQMTKDLTSLKNQQRAGMADYVLTRVSEIVQVNRQLQDRLAKAEDKLQNQAEQIKLHVVEARTDSLTGLPNRRAFDQELQRRLDRWRQRRERFCLAMVDADDFKTLNDGHGHLAGDTLLRAVAETLDAEMSIRDMAARIGGDEFGLILDEGDLEWAKARCVRLQEAIAQTEVPVDGTTRRPSMSMGLAQIALGEDQMGLMHRADGALYAAKAAGKGCGYYHDGLQCLPIVGAEGGQSGSNQPAEEPWPAANPVDPAEYEELCHDLRVRLDEVLEADPVEHP